MSDRIYQNECFLFSLSEVAGFDSDSSGVRHLQVPLSARLPSLVVLMFARFILCQNTCFFCVFV